jgi:hypothetical protein
VARGLPAVPADATQRVEALREEAPVVTRPAYADAALFFEAEWRSVAGSHRPAKLALP